MLFSLIGYAVNITTNEVNFLTPNVSIAVNYNLIEWVCFIFCH